MPHPNLPAADVVPHLGRVRLDDVDPHVEAGTPPLMYKRRHPPPRKCCEAISSSFMIELLFFFCFKTVSIHELSQDKSPRSTKVVSKWPKCCSIKKAEDPVINLCHLLLIVKRRPNCYTFLAEPRCYSYNFQNWMLHFFYFLFRMARCLQLHLWQW